MIGRRERREVLAKEIAEAVGYVAVQQLRTAISSVILSIGSKVVVIMEVAL